MLDTDHLHWLKATTNELNNLLQVISESGQVLQSLCPRTADTEKYFGILRNGVDRATKVASGMTQRIGGSENGGAPAPANRGPATPAVAAHPVEVPRPPRTVAVMPIAAPSPAAAPAPTTPIDVRIHNPTGQRELLMIVDDEEFISMLAQRVLTDAGYRVITARDGFKAIDIYRKMREQISLIILDFTMPVMDGADVFAELVEINPAVPVVLSSGFAEQGRLQTMLARGLRGFIPKPYTHEKLLTQVRSTLDALRAQTTGERRVL